MRFHLTFLAIAVFLVVGSSVHNAQVKPAAPDEAAKTIYEVYAIRYGTLPQFPVSGLVAGADRSRRMDIPVMFWLVKGNGHNILVDCGFISERLRSEWKAADYVLPSEAVARLGLKPDEITDIVLSHMHWDHAGGTTLFPKAKLWIQKAEYDYYVGEAWQARNTHGGIEPDDVMAVVKANLDGRLRFIAGDNQVLMPGITAFIGGKHTRESQYVVVTTKSGKTVVASDNVYLYENLERHVAIGGSLDAASNLATQDRMRSQASDLELIVPGHDPAVFTKFSLVAPGIVRID